MTPEETEADVKAIQAQFEAIPTQVEGSKSPISIGSPSRPSTPRDESPRSGTADSLTASGSVKKKEGNTSRVGLLLKKYLGGDKEKDKRKKEESEPSSPKPAGDLETTSEDSIASAGRDQSMNDAGQDDSISAPPASTPLRSERRRAQSRSWGENALTRSPSASVGASQSPNRSSSTLVTVTIDSPGSPSSSAPGSNRSSTQSSRPTSGAGTSPPASLKTSGGASRPTSGASSPHETSPINSSGSDKSPPLRRVTGTSGVFTRNKSGDQLNSSTPVLTHSSSTSSIPTPTITEAAPKSETAFSGASRLRRRAAVFQKSSERFGDAGFVHGTVDEQSALEEAVNIWDEPKDEHIVYEKKPEPGAEKATAGSATASPVAEPSASQRSTVMLPSQDDSSAPLAAATAGVSELSLISHERQATLGTGNNTSTATEEVASGTLNQLVKHLTSSKGVDGRALQTFLLTYTSFTSPKVLLEKLLQRYNIPKHKMEPKAGEERSQAEARARQKQLRVINFLRKWIELCFVDFTEEIIEMVFQFCEQLRTNGSTPLATLIDNALASKLAGLAKRKNTQFKQPPPASIMPKKTAVLASGGYAAYDLLDIDPVELARQLTLIDYDLFGQIRPAELLNQSWNKPKLKHRSPHVLEMIQRFNTLSSWLCSQVVHAESIKDRAKVMQHVMHLGRNLLELNNFNAFNAVLSAMQNSAVYRLSHTKEACGSKLIKQLDAWTTLMSPRQNSANYKAALAAAAAPAIPYLGLYLSQLTFIEEGNPPRLHGLINFKKCRLISKVIVNLLQYQVGKRYNFVPLDSIRDMLSTLTASETDDELYELSLKREPRMPQPS